MSKRLSSLSLLLGLFLAFSLSAREAPNAVSKKGMVASAHPIASEIGAKILAQGGNAVDAAIATAFALSVVEPYSSGLGGGGFMLISIAGPGKPEENVIVLDFRETAPMLARKDLYKKDGVVVPGLSLTGHLAVAVPGQVAGLEYAYKNFGSGKLAWQELIQPAIYLAKNGFKIDREFFQRELADLKKLKQFPAAKKNFLKAGLPYLPGENFIQPDLAKSLQAIAEQGAKVFYLGWIAEAIDQEMKNSGGLIRKEDLANFKVRARQPIIGTYRGIKIISMPPPSSGGICLLEILNILEGYDLGSLGFDSAQTVRIQAEAMKLPFYDRFRYLGDPAFVRIPVEKLLSKEYASELRKLITDKPIPSAELSKISPQQNSPEKFGNTTHLSVVDAKGMAVSLTQTINTNFGSGVVVPGTGILLNNEMDDFSADPGAPNAYGLIQGEANAIAPGKIPLSSMSPTLVFKGDQLWLVVGSPGGPRIITSVLQTIVNIIDFRMSLPEAISAKRIHHQWLPDQILLENGRLPISEKTRLEKDGYEIAGYFLPGNVQAILVSDDGSLIGVSDPRGIGKPAGVE